MAIAKRDELQAMVQFASIKAPFNGTITRRFVHPGNLVTSDMGSSPVLNIVRHDTLRLVIDLPDYTTEQIKLGHQFSYVVDSYHSKTFKGVISRLAGALASDTRTMRALSGVDGVLKPGMFCTV